MPYREPRLRLCSKSTCSSVAVSTLTYVYADAEAVVGPLSKNPEPHAYDLCDTHQAALRVPLGWRVLRYHPSPEAL